MPLHNYDVMNFAAQVHAIALAKREKEIELGQAGGTPPPLLEPYVKSTISEILATARIVNKMVVWEKTPKKDSEESSEAGGSDQD